MAKDFKVPLRVLDIEIAEQEIVADRLIEVHGDWSEDYLIPQVFVESDDGQVTHLLTGFSEAVSVTETSWAALFSSSYYKNLFHEHALMNRMSLKDFVTRYLSFQGRCRQHCKKGTSLVELWADTNQMVGAYVCPDGYVSRVIYFSIAPDRTCFKNFLLSQLGEAIVNDHDLRLATRHGWDLESDALPEIRTMSSTGVIKQIYWTTYPKTDKEKHRGIFVCSTPQKENGCRRLFVQDINSSNRLCPACQ
jgi:hypothetical protein